MTVTLAEELHVSPVVGLVISQLKVYVPEAAKPEASMMLAELGSRWNRTARQREGN